MAFQLRPPMPLAWLMAPLFLFCLQFLSGTPFVIDTDIRFIGSLLFLALFPSAIAFGCFPTLVGRIGPENAAYATVLFPIVALALSTWFESYAWQGRTLIGVGPVLMGNVIVRRASINRVATQGTHLETPVRPDSDDTLRLAYATEPDNQQ